MKKRLFGSLLFGALLVSSSSVFVSCADYDDDINANKAEIQAAQAELTKLTSNLSALESDLKQTKASLESELASVKSSYDTQLANLKAELNAAIDKKAAQSEVDNLAKEIVRVESDYKAEVAKIQSQINALDVRIAAIETLIQNKADKSELTTLEATLKALIDKKVDNETYLEAVARIKAVEDKLADLSSLITALQNEKASLDALNSKVEAINKDIEALKEALNGKVSQAAFDALQKTVDGIQDTLKDLQAQINAKASKEELNATKTELENKIDALSKDIKDNYVTNDKLAAAIAEAKSALEKEIEALKNSKADKSEISAALERIVKLETQVLALQASVTDLQNNKADKTALTEAIANLKAQVESMLASKADKDVVTALQKDLEKLAELVETKANAADVKAADDALLALITELQTNSATKKELQDAIAAGQDALAAAIEAINKNITDVQKDLQEQIDKVNIRIDDAVKDIAGALETLATVQGNIDSIDTKYANLIKELQGVDTNFGKELGLINGIIYGEEGGILSRLAVAEEALKTQNDALSKLSDALTKAKSDVDDAIAKASKAAQDSIAKEIDARIAAITEAMNAISDLETKLTDKINDEVKTLTDRIKAGEDALAKYKEDNDKVVKELKDEVGKIDEKVNAAVGEKVNNLQVFVSRYLKSISLVPQLYVGGIEAIEFNTLKYYPVKPGTSGYTLVTPANFIIVDNGLTKAYYRLNPSIINRSDIDEDNIEYLAAIAETRAAVTPTTKSPVDFVEISAWNYNGKAGLVEVALKKSNDFKNIDLNTGLGGETFGNIYDGESGVTGNGYIVALKVPRKANAENNIEAADIVSENQLVIETSIRPRIAELVTTKKNDDGSWITSVAAWKSQNLRTWNAQTDPTNVMEDEYDTHHFVDSLTIWKQAVDEDHLVFYEVVYNQTLNILDLVTGCKVDDRVADTDDECGLTIAHNKVNEITKDQLKEYGLTFRFAIPSKSYNDPNSNLVDNMTDQQQFATIDSKTGVISAKTPAGVTNNRAVVGKEPIVRIMLIDTVNSKLVDERYMKIKWVELKKDPVTLDLFTSEKPLVPCDTTFSGGITWKWFIDQVYAKINQNEKLNGISQKTFEQIYLTDVAPEAKFTKSETKWDNGKKASFLTLLEAPTAIPNTAFDAGDSRRGVPTVGLTTNENGDALIANWNMHANQIANIYPYQSKVFQAQIYFHSSLPTEYPDVIIPWQFTIDLPTLPVINGYYDNYWLNPASKDRYAHDVMGVQYNTRLYNQIKNGEVVPGLSYGVDAPAVGMQKYDATNNSVEEGTPYFVFYNNLMNAFTYELKTINKVETPLFIVKNLLGECSTWDMQFTWNGPDAILAGLTWNKSTNKWVGTAAYNGTVADHNNVVNGKIAGHKLDGTVYTGYTQYKVGSNQYRPASNTNSPALSKISWKTAGAYKLENGNGAQALQMEWWATKATDVDGTTVYDVDQSDEDHVAWDGISQYKTAVLYADHNNAVNQALLNPLSEKFEADGRTPQRTHTKPVHVGIWGTINNWNIIPVYDYDIYLVEPLRINVDMKGAFEEGHISGTAVKCEEAFAMSDFRGYLVGSTAHVATAKDPLTEYNRYKVQLYKYYEVGTPQWDTKNVRYAMKVDGSNVVRNDAADPSTLWNGANNGAMSSSQISTRTNGNIVLSIEKKTSTVDGKDYLVFKNNGGSNVEEPIYCYVPVSVTYGFGKVSAMAKIRIYPKGQAFDDEGNAVTIVDFPDGDASRRR